MSHLLQIETGIPASKQESSFMNATLSGLDSGLAISIAVSPPGQYQNSTLGQLIKMLEEDFKPLTQIGFLVEIQIGPDDVY